MTRAGLLKAVGRLRPGAADRTPDGELLERFVTDRDDAAFAELVARHGPKVFAVCRRALDHHRAEDAYQATFLVLARRAHAVRPRAAVGGFLYGVARRAAREALAVDRRRKETPTGTAPDAPAPHRPAPETDELAALDEEIADLSPPLRAAVVLCELDGLTRAEAARQLGVAEGTLSSRLAAARKRLAERLKARGVAPAAGLSTLLGLLAASARAAVPPALQAGSAAAAAIAGGVLKAMTLAKLKAPVAFAALVLALAAWAPVPPPVPAAAAAPVPKGPDRGVVWVYRPTFGPDARLTLTGYTPGGTKLEEFVLPDRDDCYLGLTPDGRKIAFVGKGGKPAETRKAEGLTVHLRDIGAAEGTDTGIPADSCPVWSRDMKRAVYAHGSRPNGEAGAAYKLLDLATRKETPLGLPADHYPVLWSPDGTWLLVVRRGGVSPVWCRYDLAGGKLETLVDRRFYYYMDLSPDGKTLIGFGQPRPEEPGGPRVRWEIDRFDVATGAMTPADKFAYGPRDGIIMSRWSPDGARVVHAVRECPPMGEESYRIVVCDPDGGNEVKLTAGRGQFMGWIYWLPTRPRPAAPK